MRAYIDLIEAVQNGPRGPISEGYTFKTDHSGYQHGQHDMHLYAEQDGAVVGAIDYTLYDGDVSIKMIRVHPRLQGNGIGSALMRELQRLYPDVEIEWGMTTPAGEALRNRLTYDDVEIPGVREKLDRMAQLKARLDGFQKAWDGFDGSAGSDERRQALLAMTDAWNEIQGEYDSLEDETHGLRPTKRIIRQV